MRAVLMVAAMLVTTGCTAAADSKPEPPPLQQAYENCLVQAPDTLSTGDGGNTLVVDTGPSGDIDAAACVLVWLDTPDSIITRLDNTTAMMGSQAAEADGFTYQWTYHPDNGLNLIITD